MKIRILIVFATLLFLSSCTVLKEYEKVNINDPDMVLATKGIHRFEINSHAYRESAGGANGGKTGGGCGCN